MQNQHAQEQQCDDQLNVCYSQLIPANTCQCPPSFQECVVPENIHNHRMEGHWKLRGGGRSQQPKFIREKKELAKLEIPEGERVQTKKAFHRGGMDIFWNHKMEQHKCKLEVQHQRAQK